MQDNITLNDFFKYKEHLSLLSTEIFNFLLNLNQKEFNKTEGIISIIAEIQKTSICPISTFLLNALNELSLKSKQIKICQNINEKSKTKILQTLLNNEKIKEIVYLSLEKEHIKNEFTLDILNLNELICLIFEVDTNLSQVMKNMLINKITLTIEKVKELMNFFDFFKIELSDLNFLDIFFCHFYRIINHLRMEENSLTTEFQLNCFNLMKNIEEKSVLKKCFLMIMSKNSSFYTMNAIENMKNKNLFEIYCNILNILFIFYIDSEKFFKSNKKIIIIDQFEDLMKFIQFIICKPKNSKKSKNQTKGKSLKALAKSLFFIQDDFFLIFSLNLIDNVDKIMTFSAFKKKDKLFLCFILFECLEYSIEITIDFLMKDSLFLELFLKTINALSEETTKTDLKKYERIEDFLGSLLSRIKLKRSSFLFNIEPLIKKLDNFLRK